MKEFIVERKKLTVESKFSYCPYCVRDYEPTGTITYKDVLPKLVFLKKMYEWADTNKQIHKAAEELYFCEKCGKYLHVDDFTEFYGGKKI